MYRMIILAIASVLMAATSRTQGATQVTNLLVNPGFEQGNVEGYTLDPQGGGAISIDTDRPHEGKFSLKQSAKGLTRWNVAFSNPVKVRPGMIYKLEFYYRDTIDPAKSSGIELRELNAQGNPIADHWTWLSSGNKEWQRRVALVRPGDNTASLQVGLRMADANTGDIWWDDVRLTAIQDPFLNSPYSLLQVSDQENGIVETCPTGNTPKLLPLWMNVGREATGGKVEISVERVLSTGIADEQPIWKSGNPLIERAGPSYWEIPTDNLKEGRYRINIDFVRLDGSERLHYERSLVVVPPISMEKLPPIRRTEIGPDGNFLVNGKPFVSIMLFHNPQESEGITKLRKMFGINFSQTWGGNSINELEKRIDDLYQNGGIYSEGVLFHDAMFDWSTKTWKTDKLTETVNRLKNHPGLLMWDLIDEPDAHRMDPAEVRRGYELVRKLDPNHIVFVNYCQVPLFDQYAGMSDLASYDYYPMPTVGINALHDYNVAIKKANPGKPLISILQTFGNTGAGIPTPAQLRAEAYFNICDGMNSFWYYSWSESIPTSSFLDNMPQLQASVRLVNHESIVMEPFLFSSKPVEVKVEGENLKHLARDVNGKTEVVIVNYGKTPVDKMRLSIPGKTIRKAEYLLDSGRQPKIANGAVIDQLAPFGVGVYRLEQ
ncbi:MAG: carbohydrate binding domain-containing protein [Phycisphaerales bacterium]|nr:carbohydrate binding domain-containing protein [Phycisphaerales bacterium]